MIIGQASVNGIIQFTDIPKVWSSNFPCVSNAVIPEYSGWGAGGWTGTDSNNLTAINIYSFTGNWGRTINTSPDDYPRSLVCSHVVRSRDHVEFLHCRQLELLWGLYNPSTDGQNRLIVCDNTWFYRRIQHRDLLMSDPDNPDTQ